MNKESSDALLLSKVNKEVQIDYLSYDYLVIAIGSETKFFGMTDVEKHAFTIKSWNDAIIIRNHVIHQLEQAELLLRRRWRQPYDDNETYDNNNISLNPNQENERQSLLTFVIVGGGFAGVETEGELNDFCVIQ
jgi:NADH dehydrogenase